VLAQIEAWLESRPENALLEAILSQGMASIRMALPQRMLAQIEAWLKSESDYWRLIGLRALVLVAADRSYPNLPGFFRQIQPFVLASPSGLRPVVLEVIQALIERSPQETAYFLRVCLEIPEKPDAARLVRQVVPAFPFQQQESLRQALRKVNPL
jgi:hypothetical protein